jgi:hypothetical protein
LPGFFTEFVSDNFTPGRAAPAAHPQTELRTNKVVPLLFGIVLSTCSGFFNSSKPIEVSSSLIGVQIYSGYGICLLLLFECKGTNHLCFSFHLNLSIKERGGKQAKNSQTLQL